MPAGVDYAFSPRAAYWSSPGWIAALGDWGAAFVGRYVSSYGPNDGNGKNLIPSEQRALHAAGVEIILYSEDGADDMKAGRARGIQRAQHFDAVAKALGMGSAVMFSCADFDASPGDQAAINAFQDGVISVVGLDRTGIYGSYYVVKRTLDAGKAKWAAQCAAWSGCSPGTTPPAGAVVVKLGTYDYRLFDKRALVRQYLTAVVGGVACDRLWAAPGDYGQWPRPGGGPVTDGPYRHEFGDGRTDTLEHWCAARATTAADIAAFSRPLINAENERILDAYLEICDALHDAGHDPVPIPAGLVVWTRNP